jgi:Uma2 family endonuclease
MAALAEFVTDYPPSFVPVREDRLSFKGLTLPVVIKLAVPMTDKELIAFSRENKAFRIECNADGDLEIMSPVGYDGSKREIFAGTKLFNWAEENGGIALGANAGFKLGGAEVRSPDAAWITSDRDAQLTEDQKRGFLPFAPDFLIEVLSETDSRRTLLGKMQMWIDAGVKLAWMIDPFAAEVFVYRPNALPEVLRRPDWVEADSVVTGFRLETAHMWAAE